MISHFFIDRPIFASVLSIVFVLAGGVAVFTLPVAQYPDVTPPTVLVTALYPGANAQTVRDTVAAPIEEQVSGVEGMMYMSSQSTNDGTYRLSVTFKLGMDSDMAQVLVQNRVSLALPVIPQLVQNEGITVKKISPNTLMIVNLISPDNRYDNIFLSNYATIYIRDELGRLPGVADVTYFGQRDYSLRAWLDPDKLAALNLTATDVVAAIAQQNLQVAAGQIGQEPVPKGQQFQLTINTLGRLVDPEQFADIIVKAGQADAAAQTLQTAGATDQPAASRTAARPSRRGAATATAPAPRSRSRPASSGSATWPGSSSDRNSTTSRARLDGQPLGGAERLPTSRLQRPGHRRPGVCQDEGVEGPFSRRAGLPDRLRHDAVRPRIGRRGLLHAPRRGDPGVAGDAGLLAELAGGDHSADRRAGGHRRHVRRDGRLGLLAEQPLAVRPGAGHRHRRGRRHRGGREHRALAGPGRCRRARPPARPWTK